MSKLNEYIKSKVKGFDRITFKLVPTYFLVMVVTLALFSYYSMNSMSTYMYNEEKNNVTNEELEKLADMYVDTENYISIIDTLIEQCDEALNN